MTFFSIVGIFALIYYAIGAVVIGGVFLLNDWSRSSFRESSLSEQVFGLLIGPLVWPIIIVSAIKGEL